MGPSVYLAQIKCKCKFTESAAKSLSQRGRAFKHLKGGGVKRENKEKNKTYTLKTQTSILLWSGRIYDH